MLWCYVSKNKKPLMSIIILEKMLAASTHKTSNLPYGMALTRISKHFGVDLIEENEEEVKERQDEINEATLKCMRYEKNPETNQ